MVTRIKEIRDKKKITQEELSVKSGISRAIISALETGKATVTTNITMQKIAEALDEDVAVVFFGA